MKRFFQYTAGLIICIFFSVGVWGQVTLVEWNFPNNPDNATADAGIAANSAKTIGAYEDGILRTPNFGQVGVLTNASNIATIWDAGNDYWQFDVNSVGYTTLNVSFSLLSPNNTSPRNFKTQYNTGSGWVDFGSGISLAKNVWYTVSDQVLPVACENLANFSIRIITTDDLGVNGNQDDTGNNRIDNIIIKGTASSCATPTAVTSSAVTATTATISWTAAAPAPANGYQYEVRTSGAAGSGASGLVTNGTTVAGDVNDNISGLSANTTYYVYVRSDCGGSSYSSWTSSYSFTTPCSSLSLNVSEGFNAAIIPSCWTQQYVSGTSNIAYVASSSSPTTSPYEGSNYVYWNSYSFTSGNSSRLVSPAIITTGTSSVDVEFYWMHDPGYSSNTTEGVQVQYSLDGTTWIDAGTFVPRYHVSLTGWNKKTITLPPGAGNQSTVYVGFKFQSQYGNNCSLDAVVIKPTPTCLPPSSLTSSSIGTTTAAISWAAAIPAPASGYDYYYSTSSTAPTGATTPSGSVGAGVLTANLSGLTGNTLYYFWVRSNCGAGDLSSWAGSSSFTTLKIEPTNQPTNFSHGTVTTTAIPLTWTAAVAGAQLPDGYLIKASDTNFATVVNPVDGTDPANVTVFTGGLANRKVTPGSSTSAATFTGMTEGKMYYYKIYSYTNTGTNINFNLTSPPQINYATKPNVATALVASGTGFSTADISWTLPASYTAGTNSIMVFVKPTNAVTAGTPTNAPSTYTANTVFGSGTAYQGDAAAYCVYKGDGTSVSITGLNAATTYHVLVLTVVDASNWNSTNSYSATTATTNCTTLKNEPTNQPTNFSHGAVTITAIPLTWTAAVAGAQAPDGYMVKLSTGVVVDPVDGTDPADDLDVAGGVANKKVTPGSATSATTFTGMAEGTMYNFKIYSYTNSGTNINYNLTSPPAINYATKPRPVNTLVFSATGTTSADITWLKHANYVDATNTIMVFVKPTSAVTAGTPTNAPTVYTANTTFGLGTAYQNDAAAYCVYKGDGTSVSITGLNAATTYHVFVISVVDASNWNSTNSYSNTEVANGMTDCDSYIPPYSQDFASFTPLCWSNTQGTLAAPTTTTGTTSSWVADGFANVGTTGAAKLNIYSTGYDEWLISPSINLGDGSVDYQLEFDLALTDYASTASADLTGTDDRFAVVISTDDGATWTSVNTLMLWNNTGSPNVYNNISNIGEEVIINLGAYSGIVKFGFYGESTVSNADNDLFVDNFLVDVVPTCPKPSALSATTTSPDQSTLSWTDNSTASLWDIEVGASGFTPTGTPTTTGVTNPYLLTGLTASTAYSYYVRADCGSGDYSEWTGPYTFTTGGPYMTFTSSTTTQTVTTDLNPGSINQQIIGVQVVTSGPSSPLSITQFNLTTNGSTSAGTDISNAKVWYTGTSATFATTTQFGSTYSAPAGAFVVTGTQALAAGTNYFWVTYDIAPGATLNNVVDARCNEITVAAATQVPTVTNPAGSRTIRDIYLISDPSTVNVCSGTFYDSGGAAGDYLINELYTKTFVAATPGSALQFVFTSFAMESCCDDLYVYDGPDNTYPQIAGSPFGTNPGTIYSSSQYMTFVFDSDGSTNGTGWAATISCVAITVPDCITYNSPSAGETGVCPGSVNLKWTGATTGFLATGYKLYFGTNNPPTNIINGTDVGNVTTYEVANLDGNTTFYWRVAPYNTAGDNTTCTVRSFTTLNIGITGTTGLTSCQNTGNIAATGGGTITWYDVPTGGTPIGTGSPFAVTYSGNTTYYVAAEAGSGGSENGGRLTTTGADGGFITTPNWGIVFNATEDFELVSTTIYPIGTGTVTLALLNDANTEIAVTSAISVTGTGASTPVVVPLGFDITAGSNYKLVLKSYTGITNIIRDFTNSFPYNSPSGAISVTGGWTGSSSSSYYWFYNLAITSGCISARVPVSVVHTADPITITPDGPTTFLDGGSVGLTASSAASPSYTYTWSPATGLNTTTGATVIADPNTTTTYTVTGTNGTCTHTEEITVTVTYPCTGLGTGHAPIASLPFNETLTTCGNVDDITSSNAIVCSSTSYYTGEDVVYSFTPTLNGLVTIDLSSTGTYTGLMLYDGCPMSGQGGNCVASAQSSTGNKSLCVNLQQDVTYYLIIDSYASPACNPYTINISAPDPVGVPNDLPCNATPIAIGGLQAGDNSCSTGTDEPTAASCWTTGTLNTVWFSFVAPASGSVKIRTTLGTLTATQIAVYQGACDNLTVVSNSCNVDASGVCSGTTNNSAVELTGLTTGNTYLIRVDGENDLTGDFDLEVIDGINSWPTVPQQDCGSATLICNQTTIVGDPGFLGAGSTCDYTTPYGCFSFGTQNNTVWYQIDIAADGNLVFDIVPNLSTTDYDWALINVTANPIACDQIAAGTLTPVRCNFSGTSGTTGLRASATNTSEGAGGPPFCSQLPVLVGQSYQLLIWNWSGNNTGFNLDMQATSPVNYATPASLTWSGGASTDWFNPVNWGGCDIPDCGIDVIIVNGPANQPIINADGAECKSISIESGASLTVNANRTLTVCDDFSNIGSLNMDPSATILLNNNGADHGLNGSLTGSNALGNLTVNKTSGSVTFMQDIEIQGDLTTANATSIIDVNGKNVTLGGDFVPWDGTYTNIGTGTLTFNGTALQNYNPGGLITLHDVTMNNSGSGLILSRNLELSATGVLTLNNGIIDGNSRRVVVANTDPVAVSIGNANSFIFGELRRYMASNAGNYYFPVGTSSAYRLAQLVNNNLAGINYIDASFSDSFVAGTISASDLGTPYISVASEGIWIITPNAQPSGGTYSILLYFDDGGASQAFSLTDNMFGPLKRLNSSEAWVTGGGTLNAESTAGRTVAGAYARRSGLSDFSEFAIGKSNTILPVTLLYVNAKCAEDDVYVNWATAQETNNSHFTVMRSLDAKYFYPVGKVVGAGNSHTPIHYSFMDENFSQDKLVYYKIIQTDFDGTETSSQVVVADCMGADETKPFMILNSANSNSVDVQFFSDSYGKANISIVDNLGRILYSDSINTADQQFVSISKLDFAPGLYSIIVSINGAVQNDQFVVVK